MDEKQAGIAKKLDKDVARIFDIWSKNTAPENKKLELNKRIRKFSKIVSSRLRFILLKG